MAHATVAHQKREITSLLRRSSPLSAFAAAAGQRCREFKWRHPSTVLIWSLQQNVAISKSSELADITFDWFGGESAVLWVYLMMGIQYDEQWSLSAKRANFVCVDVCMKRSEITGGHAFASIACRVVSYCC